MIASRRDTTKGQSADDIMSRNFVCCDRMGRPGTASAMAKPDLLVATDQFLEFLAVERGVSYNTVAAYRNDLTQFVEFITDENGRDSENGKNWPDIHSADLSRYLVLLHHKGYSEKSRARKVASLRSFFGFILEEGLVSSDPSDGIRPPRIGRPLPDTLGGEANCHLRSATTPPFHCSP